MKVSTICTILDKPKHKQIALERALELQEIMGCSIQPVSFCWNAMSENKSVYDAKERRKMRHAFLMRHEEWLHELSSKYPDMPDVRIVWEHDIVQWVTETLAEEKPDLVLKTVHHSKTLSHTPTDWGLLQSSPVPVMLAATRRPKKQKGAKAVVAALDLTHNDAKHRRLNVRVLDAAHEFAEPMGAKVHCVFAAEISPVLRDLDLVNERTARRKLIEDVTPELERLVQPYDIAKRRIHVPVGKVGPVVAQTARKVNAEMLVLGSYSHRIRQAMGLGNSAQRILTKAVCDVLAVHP